MIFNQGNYRNREALIVAGTLNPVSAPVTIPVVGGSFAYGAALSAAGSTARVRVLPSELAPTTT